MQTPRGACEVLGTTLLHKVCNTDLPATGTVRSHRATSTTDCPCHQTKLSHLEDVSHTSPTRDGHIFCSVNVASGCIPEYPIYTTHDLNSPPPLHLPPSEQNCREWDDGLHLMQYLYQQTSDAHRRFMMSQHGLRNSHQFRWQAQRSIHQQQSLAILSSTQIQSRIPLGVQLSG